MYIYKKNVYSLFQRKEEIQYIQANLHLLIIEN